MTLYSEYIMGVIEEDLGLSEEELARLEDILDGEAEARLYCGASVDSAIQSMFID